MQSMIVKKWTKSSIDDWTIPCIAGVNKFFNGYTGTEPLCFAVIVPKQTNRLLTFQCEWYDQGWGDRNGQIFIVAQDRPNYLNLRLLSVAMAKGEIVAKSPMVKHAKTSLMLPFYPKPNKVYQLWCVVGGQWYHTLRITDMSLQRLALRNPIQSWSKSKSRKRLHLEDLPSVTIERIVGFLPISDTLHLIQTSKYALRDIELSKVTSLLASNSLAFNPRSCFALIVPKDVARLHTITLQCDLLSQDWSKRMNGRVYVVAHDRNCYLDSADYKKQLEQLSFADGRVVSKTPVAKNHQTPLTLSFYPKSYEIYQLWLLAEDWMERCHTLRVENLVLHMLGFGKNTSSACDTFYTGFSFTPDLH
jgi:hypothetical protein